jgi:flavin reductase (DIM6/NTAB) family NADH-FMN oxidoreductase RutF
MDRALKRSLGQMMKGVQVVGASAGELRRLYCSHWVCQVSFDEPIVMASVSPKHDTHPLIAESGVFSVSVLAGDQVDAGQYFSYPGRRFHHLAEEMVEDWDGLPVVPNSISYLRCEVFDRKTLSAGREGESIDHELFFARVSATREGRLREPPLLYSSRLGWRVTGDKAREPGRSIRDELLARVAAAGFDAADEPDDDEDDG